MDNKDIFLKPKYSYTSDKVIWYSCPKCGHLVAYRVPQCNNCKSKMKWREK